MSLNVRTTTIHADYFCDICGEAATSVFDHGRGCCICGADMCRKHTILDPDDYGDYPDRYCSDCWEIGKEHREKIFSIQFEADQKKNEEERKWTEKAIAYRGIAKDSMQNS